MRTSALVLATAVCVLFTPARAADGRRAQQSSAAERQKAPRESAAQTAARVHFERGVAHYRAGAFEEAIAEFQQAYALHAHPALLFNIAQANERLGRAAPAIAAYRGYLAGTPDAPDRAAVEATIAMLERRLAEGAQQELRIASRPGGATVEIDAAVKGQTPLTTRLPLGTHQVRLTLPEHLPLERTVQLTASQAVSLDLTLEPVKEARPRIWTWVAVGTGVALAASAATVGYLASQDAALLRATQHDSAEVQRLHDGARSKALIANVLYGTAGAAVVAGGALFFLEGRF